MNSKPSPASIIIMVSGAVMLLFSFFKWFEVGDFGISAWTSDDDAIDPFPLMTYLPLIGLICGGVVALRTFANANLPQNIAGFTWNQIIKILGIFAVLLAIGIWILMAEDDGLESTFAFWLTLLGSIGLVVGGFMLDNEPATGSPQGPAAPF